MQNYSEASEYLSFFRVLVPAVDRNALNSELMVAGGREKGCEEGVVREFGMDVYTLLYLKWITNKDRLYSKGILLNAMWQPGWEGVWERMDTYICMTEFYFCFIYYAKAFVCVDHNKLWKILKEMGIPDHLTCLLRNLYAGQEATVKLDMEQQTGSK